MKSRCRVYFRKHKCKLFVFGVILCVYYVTFIKNTRFGRLNKPQNVTICHPNHHQVTQNTQEQNLNFVKKYEFPASARQKYREHFDTEIWAGQFVSRDVPVIGTAVSANHFVESLLMLKNIQDTLLKRYKDIKVYYYDIGLWRWQKEKIREYPMVVVRRFPFADFPGFVRELRGYAWKPLVIQTLLQEFGFVMWMDASVRFSSSNQDRLFEAAKERGVIYRPGFYNVVVHTDFDTFYFLKEEPCEFSRQNEIEANFLLIHQTHFTHDYFIKPAALCALSFGCMVTSSSHRKLDCTDKVVPHSCHRFDQSVFTLLIARLYRSEKANQVTEYSDIQLWRGLEVPFLGETLNTLLVNLVFWMTSASDICFK